MADFKDHNGVVKLLREAQGAERETREKAREVRRFLSLPDGQWEDSVKTSHIDRPRYTFDWCNTMVDDIAGEMEQADFDIRVAPAGGDATKDLAKTIDGLVRNIENLSNASDVFNTAGREMVGSGFDAWRVVQRWGDNDSFDQDLFIDGISDAIDRVWFDPNAKKYCRDDGMYVFILNSMDKEAYKEKFPKGSGQSVTTDSTFSTTNIGEAPDVIVVGEIIYKKKDKIRIVELTNGAVYKDDENYQRVKDEFEAQGITEKRERMREVDVIFKRFFDAQDWLTEPEKTVFDFLPVVPTYGNFKVIENRVDYWGIVTKKMDAQRVYNYTESRKVEEGALAPLDKIVASIEQVEGREAQWSKLNVSKDPALFYTHVDGQVQPYKIGGAQVNPGLEITSQSMLHNLQSVPGLDRQNGQSLGLRSGAAVELEQNKGDTRNYKYTVSQQKSIQHTGKILIRALPKVYDNQRTARVLNEDASFDIVTLNQRHFDEQTGQPVTLNDLSKGSYDVTCDVGEAFKNRQSETSEAFAQMAEQIPEITQLGLDIWLNNISSPGMDLLAARARQQMVLAGQIPEDQLTDEEIEFLQNQPEPPPDPVAVALERESENAENETQLKAIKEAREDRKLDMETQMAIEKQELEEVKVQIAALTAAFNGIKQLADAKGVEGVDIPGIDGAISGQTSLLKETQTITE